MKKWLFLALLPCIALGQSNNYQVVDLSAATSTVTVSVPAVVEGVCVNATTSTAVDIDDGSTTVLTIPSSTAAGSCFPLYRARFVSNITVVNASTQTVTVTVVYDSP